MKQKPEQIGSPLIALGSVPIPNGILLDCLRQSRELIEKADYASAIHFCQKALGFDDKCAQAYWLLGKAYFKSGAAFLALDNYALAVVNDPSNADYKQEVIDWFNLLEVRQLNDFLKMLLVDCMESKDVSLAVFYVAWLSILKHDPEFSEIYRLMDFEKYEIFCNKIPNLKNIHALLDPFFLTGLGRFIVPVRKFENFMTNLRRYCLETDVEGQNFFENIEENEFILAAMSRYAFFTEYVWNEVEEETQNIERLRQHLEKTNNHSLSKLMIFACYRPLWSLKNADEILKNIPIIEDHVSSIPRSQIADYLRQQDIKKKIKNLTLIKDEISLAVQSQYEEFPYPTWETLSKKLPADVKECRLLGKKAKILVAGCGTGQQALQLAALFPDSSVTAIDLSRSSLAYAMMRSEQLEIKNATFWNADIMALDVLEEKFDYIASSGVLHHMRDPKAGWAVLQRLLKPNGLMRIALYSRAARASVIEARKIIAAKVIKNDAQSVRDFRTNIAKHLDKKYLEFFDRSLDYFTLNMCRDLLFHVQEHQFDLIQIKEILEELKLHFLGFHIDERIIKKCKAENKNQDILTDIDAWSRFEQKNPDTFPGMYDFWCEKKN